MCTDVRTNIHDAEKFGRPSVITEALKQKLNRIIQENRHFIISEVYEQCLEVSRALVYQIVTKYLQRAVLDWLNFQAAVWYEERINKLVSRYDKCLNVQGDYVEK
jgi:hypothetical protein